MANYQVIICDPFGNQLDTVDEWVELHYTRALNNIGALVLTLDGSYTNFGLLKIDGRLFVQRAGKIDTDTCWFIREIVRILDSDGRRLIQVGAVSANEILKRRVVAYTEGTSQAVQTDRADDLMKTVVRQNFGSSASAFRNISTYLSIKANVSLGPSVSQEMAYKNVLAVLRTISEVSVSAGSAVYFDITTPNLTTMEFDTYRGFRGLDHRYLGGLSPVVVSPDRGTLVNVERSYDWSNEITYTYGGGQEAIYTASSFERINQSPFNLRESYININGTSGSDAAQDETDAAVWAGRPKRTFQGELVNVPGATEYGVHWGFGDALTCSFEGENIDCTVDVVDVSVKQGKEVVRASLRVIEDS